MNALVYLYYEPSPQPPDLAQLPLYLQSQLPRLQIESRPDFVSFHLSRLDHAQREAALADVAAVLARAKVRNPTRQNEDFEPLLGEIEYEKRRLASPGKQPFGLLYDGFKVMQTLRGLLPPVESGLAHLHIVFTNQLLGTWEDSGRRYHARTVILGFPSLISTTGLVEAPAKPREYYLLKQQYQALGLEDAPAVALDSQFRARFLDHGDPRLTEAVKGYAMQAVFYHFLGEAFCEDRNCQLYNAHWQQEVLQAQLESPYELCPRHKAQLAELA